MSKEIKGMMRMMSYQIDNISKKVNFIKQSQNQIKILENNLRKQFTRRAQHQAEGKTFKLEHRSSFRSKKKNEVK